MWSPVAPLLIVIAVAGCLRPDRYVADAAVVGPGIAQGVDASTADLRDVSPLGADVRASGGSEQIASVDGSGAQSMDTSSSVSSDSARDAPLSSVDSQGETSTAPGIQTVWKVASAAIVEMVAVADRIYVTGAVRGTVDLGRSTVLNSAGDADIFLAAYSSEGALIWGKRFGGVLQDRGAGLTVDGEGNVWVSGVVVSDSADLGGMVFQRREMRGGFIAKYSGDGQLLGLWEGGGGEIAFDASSGSVVVAGPVTTRRRLDGQVIWQAPWPTTVLAVAQDQGVVAAGDFTNELRVADKSYQSKGETDAFVVKFGGTGAVAWFMTFGAAGYDNAQSLTLDDRGDVFLAGEYDTALSIGPYALVSRADSGDAFVTRILGFDGTVSWATSIASAGRDSSLDLLVKAEGRLLFSVFGHPLLTLSSVDGKILTMAEVPSGTIQAFLRTPGGGLFMAGDNWLARIVE